MDRVEQIAEAIHDGWWDHKLSRGWRLGPRNPLTHTHPHMVPWSALDDESRNQDRFIASLVLAEHMTGSAITCKFIHEAWRVWETLHDTNHQHNLPFEEAHLAKLQPGGLGRTGRKKAVLNPREHANQVIFIKRVIAKWKKNERRD